MGKTDRLYLTVTEVADLTGFSPQTIRRHIRKGKIDRRQYTYVGRNIRFYADAVLNEGIKTIV